MPFSPFSRFAFCLALFMCIVAGVCQSIII